MTKGLQGRRTLSAFFWFAIGIHFFFIRYIVVGCHSNKFNDGCFVYKTMRVISRDVEYATVRRQTGRRIQKISE